MVTIISYKEFEKLLRRGELRSSTNLEFLDEKGLTFLKDEYHIRTGKEAGLILYLLSVNGKELQNISESVLSTHTNDLAQHLSLPDGEAVLLVTKDNMEALKIDRDVLDDLQKVDYADAMEIAMVKMMLSPNAASDESECIYAISDVLSYRNVQACYHSPELGEKIEKLKAEVNRRNLACRPTSFFKKG